MHVQYAWYGRYACLFLHICLVRGTAIVMVARYSTCRRLLDRGFSRVCAAQPLPSLVRRSWSYVESVCVERWMLLRYCSRCMSLS